MEYRIRSSIKVGIGSDAFVDVATFKGKLPDLTEIKGAIEWSIGDVTILNDADWDIVDLLWLFILNGLLEMRKKDIAEVHFPGQPLSLLFTTVPPHHALIRLLILDKYTSALVDRAVMVRSLCDGGRSFFLRMSELAPELKKKWDDGLQKVAEVERLFLSVD